MKTKIILIAVLAATTGAFLCARPHSGVPSDLRDAVADSALDALKVERGDQDIKVPEPEMKPFHVESAPEGVTNKGYMPGTDPLTVSPAKPVEYITIAGGKFIMGTTSWEDGLFGDAKPVHEVTIKTFQMAKTPVTVAQYAECVLKGLCTEPSAISEDCNWGRPANQLHPVNCVDWNQAQAYAKFKGARLPSEAEFEYAATSGGRNQKYPWGNAEPTSKLAVFDTNSTMPVCSKPKGNTAQGLCDMSGNVYQWMQDKYQDSYKGVPADGSAFVEGPRIHRVLRGGSFHNVDARTLRADCRYDNDPDTPYYTIGFRLAR